MVKRKITKNKYVLAAIITIIIFVSGVFIGLYVEKERVNYTSSLMMKQKIDTASLQVLYLYLTLQEEGLGNNCVALEELLRQNLKSLDTSMKKAATYKEGAIIDGEEFELIQREFIIEQVKYWLLANEVGDTCNTDHLSVFSFYDGKCGDCEKQRFVLEYFKRTLGEDFLLFHFDNSLNDPLITTMIKQYNITSYPTTVIEGQKFDGLRSATEMRSIICSFYETKPELCVES